MAVPGFGVTELLRLGLLLILAGAATLLLATPGIFMLAGMVTTLSARTPQTSSQH